MYKILSLHKRPNRKWTEMFCSFVPCILVFRFSFLLLNLDAFFYRHKSDFQEKEKRWICFPSETCAYQREGNIWAASQHKLDRCAFYSAILRHYWDPALQIKLSLKKNKKPNNPKKQKQSLFILISNLKNRNVNRNFMELYYTLFLDWIGGSTEERNSEKEHTYSLVIYFVWITHTVYEHFSTLVKHQNEISLFWKVLLLLVINKILFCVKEMIQRMNK